MRNNKQKSVRENHFIFRQDFDSFKNPKNPGIQPKRFEAF